MLPRDVDELLVLVVHGWLVSWLVGWLVGWLVKVKSREKKEDGLRLNF